MRVCDVQGHAKKTSRTNVEFKEKSRLEICLEVIRTQKMAFKAMRCFLRKLF